MASLAAPYSPRRPTDTVLHTVVREHLATFLRFTRDTYEKPLPRYVENELRAYLKCGVFEHGFVRLHCDGCGHDLLVAFSCKGRGVCPSCGGRRMASTAAHLVDRVLPTVPLRQWVLSLPFEIRRLAAFDPKVLSRINKTFVEEIFAHYRGGMTEAEAPCGAVTFVQRFGGSLNLNVHFHVVALDGVFVGERDQLRFLDAPTPTRADLAVVVRKTAERVMGWLDRHARAFSDGDEPDAITACASAAMQRGIHVELPATKDEKVPDDIPESHASAAYASFDVHAGVRIRAEDHVGRERLCRYGARPAFATSRFRQLPNGQIAFRVKYADKGKAKHRIMTPLELLARISALIPPPRYPLVRYHGVLAPASPWRKWVIPKPPTAEPNETACDQNEPKPPNPPHLARSSRVATQARPPTPTPSGPRVSAAHLAPNILTIPHWKRLGEGALLARSPRVDWATLLRRTFDVDIKTCIKCGTELELRAVVTEHTVIRSLLDRLDIERPPRPRRARDPTTLFYADDVN